MKSKFRGFAPAIAAVLAAMAISASNVSAAEFHSETAHTVLSAEQHAGEDTLTFSAGPIRCPHVTYAGTASSATSTTQTFSPSYTGCNAGFLTMPVDVNGCTYRYDSSANNVDIVCGANPITITAFNCWITIGSQENIGTVTYTNQGAGKTRDITIDLNLTGIKYTQHSKSFPGCTNGTFTNGTYTGAATVRGFDTGGSQVGIWNA